MELKAQPTECPYCTSEGKVSSLKPSITSVDGAGVVNAYHDTSNHYHVHDPNVHHALYECTSGHRFRTAIKMGCPSCQFNRPVRMVAEKIDGSV